MSDSSTRWTELTWDDEQTTDHRGHWGEFRGFGPLDAEAPSLTRLRNATAGERRTAIGTYVRTKLSRTLGLPDGVPLDRGVPLERMGLGSIAGLELQRRVQAGLGIRVGLQPVLLAEGVEDLVDHVVACCEEVLAV